MQAKQPHPNGLLRRLRGEQVRQTSFEGRHVYAIVDAIAELTNPADAPAVWAELKSLHPEIAKLVSRVTFPSVQQSIPGFEAAAESDATDFDGVMRIVQVVPGAKAERLRRWLAVTARERLEEAENPELAVVRTRRLYEQHGYSPRWVDKRLRGVSARQELTAEWFRRGARESDQYRALTNDMMRHAFGMDVEDYRRFKNLFKTGENLRDHMNDLELALTALGETVAVELHRQRNSQSFESLDRDASEAGEVVAKVRGDIESRLGRAIVEPGNHRGWWARRGRSRQMPVANVA